MPFGAGRRRFKGELCPLARLDEALMDGLPLDSSARGQSMAINEQWRAPAASSRGVADYSEYS